MRRYIDILEGEVIPFPGNNRPTNKMAVAKGGADIYRAVKNPPLDSLDEFTGAYITAALWTDEEQLENDGVEVVSWEHVYPDTAEIMVSDCAQFQKEAAPLLDRATREFDYDRSDAGHDFWLTRNGHGVGFWDRGLGQLGDDLTKLAKRYGEVYLSGENGVIFESILVEATIPPTDYGYWITEYGEFIKVGYEQHDDVANFHGMGDGWGSAKRSAIQNGWVRVVLYGKTLSIEAATLNRKTVNAIRSLALSHKDYLEHFYLDIGMSHEYFSNCTKMLLSLNKSFEEMESQPLYENRLPLQKGQLSRGRGSYAAFIIVMDPNDFIRLTTPASEIPKIFSDRFAKLADYKSGADETFNKSQYGIPFLDVMIDTGKVVGHEGRHRAAMVANEGGKSFPCLVYMKSPRTYVLRYVVENWKDDSEEEIFETFKTEKAASDREDELRRLRVDPEHGLFYSGFDLSYEGGGTMKGSPRSTLETWTYDAWRVDDMPKALVGQFEPSVVVKRFKVGLVKGHRHFKS